VPKTYFETAALNTPTIFFFEQILDELQNKQIAKSKIAPLFFGPGLNLGDLHFILL
jgi:hypothetical protein